MASTQINEREFARLEVQLRARFRVVESDEDLEALTADVLRRPSVWGLEGESELWHVADSPQSGPQGLLARAVLDLARQVQRVSGQVLDESGPMNVGSVVQLSGGGIRFATSALFSNGTILLLRLMDERMEAPPVRALAEVAHVEGEAAARYGLAFTTIHPADRERLIRYIYQLQRRALRRGDPNRD